MESLIQLIRTNIDLSDEDLKVITSSVRMKTFAADSVILQQGDVEHYLSYIEEGISRYFYTDADGREVSILFTFKGWFLGEASSFITRTPSFCSIEAVSDTRVWRIHYDDLQKIYATTRGGERFGRLMMEQLYIRKAQRERSLLVQTAEERYLDLLKNQPHILQCIQLKHIASYIGITPQALSRIRRRIN